MVAANWLVSENAKFSKPADSNVIDATELLCLIYCPIKRASFTIRNSPKWAENQLSVAYLDAGNVMGFEGFRDLLDTV